MFFFLQNCILCNSNRFFTAIIWYIEPSFHRNVIQSQTINWIYSCDVKVSLYCDYHMLVRLTLFCISLVWIELNFVFGHVVSFAIHVARLN